MLAVVILFLIVWPQAPATAPALETAGEWGTRCGAEGERCRAWVEGLVDMNEIYRGLGALEKTSEGFCMPREATVEQAARIVAVYIADHPAASHFSARIVAYMALRAAYRCATAR